MKTFILLFAALWFVVPAEAATEKRRDPKKEAREKEKALRDKDREEIKKFLEPKDKNKDGVLSRDEFIADETDKEAAGQKFDEANKNKDRALTRPEISDMLGLGKELEQLKQDEKDKRKKK